MGWILFHGQRCGYLPFFFSHSRRRVPRGLISLLATDGVRTLKGFNFSYRNCFSFGPDFGVRFPKMCLNVRESFQSTEFCQSFATHSCCRNSISHSNFSNSLWISFLNRPSWCSRLNQHDGRRNVQLETLREYSRRLWQRMESDFSQNPWEIVKKHEASNLFIVPQDTGNSVLTTRASLKYHDIVQRLTSKVECLIVNKKLVLYRN